MLAHSGGVMRGELITCHFVRIQTDTLKIFAGAVIGAVSQV